MQLLGLKSFKAAAVMLGGLALYDIFWVFGSPKVVGDNVMLAVATSDILTGPTRLLFPRFSGSLGEGSAFPFSLLGQLLSSVFWWHRNSLCFVASFHALATCPTTIP